MTQINTDMRKRETVALRRSLLHLCNSVLIRGCLPPTGDDSASRDAQRAAAEFCQHTASKDYQDPSRLAAKECVLERWQPAPQLLPALFRSTGSRTGFVSSRARQADPVDRRVGNWPVGPHAAADRSCFMADPEPA